MIRALDLGATAPLPYAGGAARVRIASALRAFLALMLVGNLGRVPVWSTAARSTPILMNDVILLGLLLAGLVAALQHHSLRIDLTATLALAFAAVGAGSALLAVSRFGLGVTEFAVSIAYLLRWIAYFCIYPLVVNFVDAADVGAVWRTLNATVLAFAAFGVIQSLFLPGFAQMVQPDAGWDVQGHRLVSTFLDPNFAGGLIAAILLVQLGRMAFGARVPLWQPLLLVSALLLTISRSSLLGFAVGACLILAVRGLARKVVRFGGIVALLILPFLPLLIAFAARFGRFSIEGSAALRFISWMHAIRVFSDHPVIGIGFNTYGFVQRAYGWTPTSRVDFTLDGGLLFIAVMTGLVGVALYSGMLGAVLLRCRRAWKDRHRPGEERGLALGVAAATIALVVHSIFLNSLLYPFLMEVLWILWGLIHLVSRSAPPRPATGSGAPV
ncbi:MAG TPA: O-antigen ligase family protein [Longimicrobiaceae bacterium]|nr:O-antigen ligase family protein [Longimicrobiaceae bacterium]